VGGSVWQEEIPKGHYTRHPSNKNLKDIVDLFIDDYNPVGDSVIELEGFDRAIAPISNVTDSYIVRRIEIEAINTCLIRDLLRQFGLALIPLGEMRLTKSTRMTISTGSSYYKKTYLRR